MPTRILIVDDHEVMRHGLRTLLKARPDWEVCGEAADGREAIEKCKELGPDIIILDITMPTLNGLDAARQIKKLCADAKVLMFSMHESEQVIRQVLRSGADGFVLKSDAARDLLDAIHALVRNRTFFTMKAIRLLQDGGTA